MRYFAYLMLPVLTITVGCRSYIDPTGTYQLQSERQEIEGETYGYSGQIQVKKTAADKIAITFDINKGAPSYNMGIFVDTLDYLKNKAVYTTPEYDSMCRITLDFTKNGITVKEETADYNFGCGFGHAVVADGFFKKISAETPVLTYPGTGEVITPEGDSR